MVGLMSNMGNRHEPIALMSGLIGVILSVLFFLQKFAVIAFSFEIMDTTYMWFFAGFTLLASAILLFTTLGFIGVK